MLESAIGIFLILLSLLAFMLQRFYSSVPAKELKRLAARGEQLAKVLYRPVAYGTSLRVLLWVVAGISMPVGFLLVSLSLNIWLALAIMVVSLSAALIWLPSLNLTLPRSKIAVKAAPALEWLLHYTHPFLDQAAKLINSRRGLYSHSGLYEQEDLLELLSQQRLQPDNRIDPKELDFLLSAFSFKDLRAVDVMEPDSNSKLISSGDSLGPVLLDELYKTGQKYFAVYRGKKDNIVGMMSLDDVNDKDKNGHVSDIMRDNICFVNEDFSLPHVIKALIKSGQQSAFVINKFEEFIGLITLNGLMERLFAQQLQNVQDANYFDRPAVAAYEPSAPEPAVDEQATEEDSGPEPTGNQPEVLE